MTPTVSVPMIVGLRAQAAGLGLDLAAIDAAMDLPEGALDDLDGRVPNPALHALFREARTQTGDPAVGLRMAAQVQTGRLGVLEYAVRHSDTLGAGLDRVRRYSRVMHNGISFRLEGDDPLVLAYVPTEEAPIEAMHWVMATVVLIGRQLVGRHWDPVAVQLAGPAPDDLATFRFVFGVTPTFEAGEGALAIRARDAQLPAVAADPNLAMLLERMAERLMGEIPQSERVVDQVRAALGRELSGGNPRLEAIADQLGVSPRTLQRKLKQEGVPSYQAFLDQVRHELALRYLANQELAVREAAFLLGFSDPSTFHRAFKRWTGQTPGAFREAALG